MSTEYESSFRINFSASFISTSATQTRRSDAEFNQVFQRSRTEAQTQNDNQINSNRVEQDQRNGIETRETRGAERRENQSGRDESRRDTERTSNDFAQDRSETRRNERASDHDSKPQDLRDNPADPRNERIADNASEDQAIQSNQDSETQDLDRAQSKDAERQGNADTEQGVDTNQVQSADGDQSVEDGENVPVDGTETDTNAEANAIAAALLQALQRQGVSVDQAVNVTTEAQAKAGNGQRQTLQQGQTQAQVVNPNLLSNQGPDAEVITPGIQNNGEAKPADVVKATTAGSVSADELAIKAQTENVAAKAKVENTDKPIDNRALQNNAQLVKPEQLSAEPQKTDSNANNSQQRQDQPKDQNAQARLNLQAETADKRADMREALGQHRVQQNERVSRPEQTNAAQALTKDQGAQQNAQTNAANATNAAVTPGTSGMRDMLAQMSGTMKAAGGEGATTQTNTNTSTIQNVVGNNQSSTVKAGPSMASPTIPTTGLDRSEMTQQVVKGIRAAVNQKGGTVTLNLRPAELGQLRIKIQIDNGMVQASFTASTDKVKDVLDQSMNTLRRALENHGLGVDRLNVQTTQSNDSQQARQDGQQPQGDGRSRGFMNQEQQSGQDGSDHQGGNQRQRDFKDELLDLVA